MVLLLAAALTLVAVAVAPQDRARYEGAPIHYERPTVADPIARLRARMAAGEVVLEHDDERGYLDALLAELGISTRSQMLVFSKTSFQAPLISPSRPRAVYFADDVYVGWVPGAPVMEVTSVDPEQGPIFYTVDQSARDGAEIRRADADCLSCHDAARTRGWPGHLLRSVHPDASGMPILRSGSFTVTYESPLEQRWGGWYVTGTHGAARHMGNAVARETDRGEFVDVEDGANVVDLTERLDTSRYPSPHSDIVALLVLEHQTEMQNRFARASYQVRLAAHYQSGLNEALGEPEGTISESTARSYARQADSIVDAMLFRGEPALTDPIVGTSGFAAEFSARGLRDAQGRSLFQLDLETRLFRYPCSYLIDSDAFRALPAPLLERVWRELWDVLNGHARERDFGHLSEADRRAIVEIVAATVPGRPAYWTQDGDSRDPLR